jgi:hypothetical protein
VAIPLLVALRLELPHNGSKKQREYLMSTESLYEQWLEQHQRDARDQGLKEGRKEGRTEGRKLALRHAIRTVYGSRFGSMPPALIAILDATHDLARLDRWLARVAVGSAEDFAAALAARAASGIPSRSRSATERNYHP